MDTNVYVFLSNIELRQNEGVSKYQIEDDRG